MSNDIETEFSKSHILTRTGGRRLRGRNWNKESDRSHHGVNIAIAESRALLSDEDLKLHVYKKTLQAYLYPISNTTPHKFIVWTAKKPAHCYECEGLLWGIARQGLRCIECGVKCHERCQDLLNADCLQRAAAKSSQHGAADKTHNIIEAIRERMENRERDKRQTFSMIRNMFDIPPDRHVKHMRASKQSVLDGTCKWSAKLIVTIVEAKGLQAKDKTGASDPYVTVEVGKMKKRTKTIFNTLDPIWNQTYEFECHDSTDRLKIQVWDEDDDIKSVVKQKLLRESDDFLGHALILIHALSGDMDVWYNLEKRTERSAVSGTIHIKISMEVKGEEKCAPYRRQYTCLHENIFHQLFKMNDNKLVFPDTRGVEDGWKLYFPGDAQDVVNEFAMRYGIEPMYQAMTHFTCLASAYQSVGVRAVMSQLLSNITKNLIRAQEEKPFKQFEATNFEKGKFQKLLDNLLNSLRLDLSMYRKNFTASKPEKLSELTSCIALINAIGQFKSKVLRIKCETDSIISASCKQCMEKTYTFLFENCTEMYADHLESTSESSEQTDANAHDSAESLDFWMKLVTLIAQIFEEDKSVYAPIFEGNTDICLCDISYEVMWNSFCEDLQKILAEHSISSSCKSNEFMNLQFKVKWLYKEYIVKMKQEKSSHFFSYFEPFTMRWLEDNDIASVGIMEAAFSRDRDSGFMKTAEHSQFSSSVIDIFTQINQSSKILSKLELDDVSLNARYLKKFSKNIATVLHIYVKLIQSAFPELCKNVETACIVMNNIHQARVLLEKLFQAMGGEMMPSDARDVLSEVQNDLNNALDRLAVEFVATYRRKLSIALTKLGKLLRAIKGGGSVAVAPQQSPLPTRESEAVIKPLMDVLDTCLTVFGKSSAKTILKRVLKELWKLTITLLETVVVLPTISKDETVGGFDDAAKSLTPKQCSVLEAGLHQIKEYFHASDKGLKWSYLEKSTVLQKLTYALSLYTQTTDALVKLFVQSQNEQDSEVDENSSMGEVHIQVDLFTHPGTGQHKVTVKVQAAEQLQWKASSVFRPFIEVYIIGPYLAGKKRRHATGTKSGTTSPKFDETFTFELGNESTLDTYEVHLCAKDFCFLREDETIGVGILQLKEVIKQGSCVCWCPLARALVFNQTGKTILRILSQRVGDNIAKEFVRVKTTVRQSQATE